jgi:hypothetical protein
VDEIYPKRHFFVPDRCTLIRSTALREMRLEVALDGKPPKAPPSPITIRRFPRKATPEIVLLFDKTASRKLSIDVSYRWGLLGSGGGSASASKLLPPCQSAPSQSL